ncbi:MAG: hypothetical protein PUA49_09335 [Butyrivibrio sp.]|nr:hypothetical protein [Butyrivibrio sp.]
MNIGNELEELCFSIAKFLQDAHRTDVTVIVSSKEIKIVEDAETISIE